MVQEIENYWKYILTQNKQYLHDVSYIYNLLHSLKHTYLKSAPNTT